MAEHQQSCVSGAVCQGNTCALWATKRAGDSLSTIVAGNTQGQHNRAGPGWPDAQSATVAAPGRYLAHSYQGTAALHAFPFL